MTSTLPADFYISTQTTSCKTTQIQRFDWIPWVQASTPQPSQASKTATWTCGSQTPWSATLGLKTKQEHSTHPVSSGETAMVQLGSMTCGSVRGQRRNPKEIDDLCSGKMIGHLLNLWETGAIGPWVKSKAKRVLRSGVTISVDPSSQWRWEDKADTVTLAVRFASRLEAIAVTRLEALLKFGHHLPIACAPSAFRCGGEKHATRSSHERKRSPIKAALQDPRKAKKQSVQITPGSSEIEQLVYYVVPLGR